MAVFSETIKLDDQVSAPAAKASGAMKKGSAEAKAWGAAMAAARAQAKALGDTTNAAAAGIGSSTAKIGASTKGVAKIFPNLTDKLMRTQGTITGLADAEAKASASSGGLQAELAELTGGLSIAVEVLGAVALGMGALVLAGVSLAISAAGAKQKIVTLFDALGEGKITGKQTVAMLDELGDQIGQTRDQLAPLAKGFLTMGITGTAALRSLTLAAASAGALAEGGAEKFTTMFGVINAAAETGSKLTIPFKKLEKQLQGVGLNIGDLAKEMGTTEAALTSGLKAGTVDAKKFGDALTAAATSKGAGPLANAGKQLGAIWAKATEDVTKMFEDIDVGPFLKEVKDMFAILGQGKPSGEALTKGIGGFFKQVFTLLTKVVPLAKHFLLDMIIYGLKAYIAVKPIIGAIKEFATSAEGAAIIGTVLSALWNVLKVVGVVIGVVVVAVLALWAAMIVVSVAVWTAVGAFLGLFDSVGSALGGWIASAAKAAYDFVAGLVSGIADGAGAVIGAVTGLADKATGAFKSALGIASPSKVMAGLGGHVAAGTAEGIEAGSDDVHGAASGMATAAVKGATSGGGGGDGGGAAKGATTINVTVQIDGAGKSAMDITQEMVSLVFERAALAAGV